MESLTTILATMIGAAISAYLANHYYKKATKDLLIQVGLLKDQNNIMLRSMENAGMVTLNYDDNGNVIGIVHFASAHLVAGPATAAGLGTVTAKKVSANSDTEKE